MPAPTAGGLAGDLEAFEPASDLERRDLERARRLVASGADPFSRGLACHLTGSAVVVHLASRSVLLRYHDRQQAWLQLGGHGDEGESDAAAVALREAEEESGLDDLAPRPGADRPELVHVVEVPVRAGKGEEAHHHLDLRYLFVTAAPERARPERPDAPVAWRPIDEAIETVEPNLAETLRRVRSALGSSR